MDQKNFSYLKQAIKSNDIPYIQSFLIQDKKNEIKSLSIDDKIQLLTLLKKNRSKFGLMKEILEVARVIIDTGDVKNKYFCDAVDEFCRGLDRQCCEYSRLLYLKGKIEYLKTKIIRTDEKKPLN
ncbi:hypothetical protein COBT_000259, partial [Conglomerata obtusa]